MSVQIAENINSRIYEIEKNGFLFSTDKKKLDISYVHSAISNTYWAKDRSKAVIIETINNSLCYGVYHGSEQIGFARLITDYATYGLLVDVFIEPAWRNQGIGKILIDVILHSPVTSAVYGWMLSTKDAHGLYEKFGFEQSSTLMKLSTWHSRQGNTNENRG